MSKQGFVLFKANFSEISDLSKPPFFDDLEPRILHGKTISVFIYVYQIHIYLTTYYVSSKLLLHNTVLNMYLIIVDENNK